MKLADAREAVGKAIKKIHDGHDPAAETIAAKKQERDADSFAELAYRWVDEYARENRRTWQADRKHLEADAIPKWGRRKAKSITKRDVKDLIKDIKDRGAPVMANRTLGLIKQIFKWGVEEDYIAASPAVSVRKPTKEVSRDRLLDEEEIRRFWTKLDSCSMSEDTRIALKLCLVTAQRRAEVTGLSHSEIDGDWWTLPKNRSKNGNVHRIYLSPLARKLIKQASGDSYLFPSPRKEGPIEPRALINALAKNRQVFDMPRFTVHDLRRAAATRMGELGVSRFDISKVLNHVDQDVTSIYDLYTYDPEKKRALLKWGRRLQNIIDGKKSKKVVSINR
jgi:integrase